MINKTNEGSLNMIDLPAFNKSLKASWIKKYLQIRVNGNLFWMIVWKSLGAVIVLAQY